MCLRDQCHLVNVVVKGCPPPKYRNFETGGERQLSVEERSSCLVDFCVQLPSFNHSFSLRMFGPICTISSFGEDERYSELVDAFIFHCSLKDQLLWVAPRFIARGVFQTLLFAIEIDFLRAFDLVGRLSFVIDNSLLV